MRRRAVLAAGLAATVAVAAAHATTSAQLALMPLPKPALGAVAAGLPLDPSSGVQSNADAARDANGKVTAAQLAGLGRIGGYLLDYDDESGKAITAGHGLLDVQSSVERYRSAADAVRGLAFWRNDEADLTIARATGIRMTQRFFTPAGVPGPSFGMQGTVKVPGKPAIYGVDIAFRDGDVVAEVSVSAADPASRRAYAESLAAALAKRVDGVRAGRIKGPPVPLPGKAKAGPPPGGPDLSKLALTVADLKGPAAVSKQGYILDKDLTPVSAYSRQFLPAGTVISLEEEVALFHSPTEATYSFAGLSWALATPLVFERYAGTAVRYTNIHRVTVHAGDEAAGVSAVAHLAGNKIVNVSFVVVRVAATMEVTTLADPAPMELTPATLQAIATAVASRARAGLHG